MDLKKWADSKSTFVKVGDGESITAVFKKAVEVEDTFNPEQMKINYTLEIDGEQKILGSMSVSLARQMANIKEGEIIKISRSGEARNTKWAVGKVVAENEITEEDLDKADKAISGKK